MTRVAGWLAGLVLTAGPVVAQTTGGATTPKTGGTTTPGTTFPPPRGINPTKLYNRTGTGTTTTAGTGTAVGGTTTGGGTGIGGSLGTGVGGRLGTGIGMSPLAGTGLGTLTPQQEIALIVQARAMVMLAEAADNRQLSPQESLILTILVYERLRQNAIRTAAAGATPPVTGP